MHIQTATGRKPVVVLDAGIATKDNLKLLKKNKFEYLCVSRSGMNKYTVDTNSKPVSITDKKKQPLALQKVNVADSDDTWLRVHSQAKGLKESGMNSRFSERFEQELTQIKESLDKNGKFNYSKIVDINFEGNNTLQVFPNPTKDILHVQVTGRNENGVLQVIDLNGRKIKEQQISVNGTTSISVDINDLPKGMYNLVLKTSSKTKRQKFVKQ